jgi:hypothetical protein
MQSVLSGKPTARNQLFSGKAPFEMDKASYRTLKELHGASRQISVKLLEDQN